MCVKNDENTIFIIFIWSIKQENLRDESAKTLLNCYIINPENDEVIRNIKFFMREEKKFELGSGMKQAAANSIFNFSTSRWTRAGLSLTECHIPKQFWLCYDMLNLIQSRNII